MCPAQACIASWVTAVLLTSLCILFVESADGMRRAALGTTAAVAAAAGAYSTNERVVEQRAAQLEGLRASSAACCAGYPRTACGDTEALTSFDS